jgi:peptidoglycan LD-endopeptidase LytH
VTGNVRTRTGIVGRACKALGLMIAGTALFAAAPDGTSKSSELLLAPYLPRSAHHAYGYSLALGGLHRSPAKEWVLASERAMFEADSAELPIELAGTFEAERPEALGLSFEVRGGRRLYVDVETESHGEVQPRGGRSPFIDLFQVDAGRLEPIERPLPLSIDPSGPEIQHVEVASLEPGRYVLRVQPEIGYAGSYRVSVRTAPLLMFPVDGMSTRAILSGFGAERDGGARAHRGVDIFAPRGTPALAAMDAFVSRVETTTRGGNVVWLQPLFGDLRLYYAHLDTQLVRPGDFVLAGEAVGTVGNTGNAITTPPHLHFGVYVRRRGMRGGAQDPYPFLD